MITIKDANDTTGSKQIIINQDAEDGKSSWNVRLTTSDLPDNFDTQQRVSYDLDIIADDMRAAQDGEHVLFIPVQLVGVSMDNGQTRYSYGNRFPHAGRAASELDIQCSILKETGTNQDPDVSYDLNTPYLRIAIRTEAIQGSQQEDQPASQAYQSRERQGDSPGISGSSTDQQNGRVETNRQNQDNLAHA